MRTFAFRCDSSTALGSGHLKRCISLAKELQLLGCRCVFITKIQPGSLHSKIIDQGFDLCLLDSPALSYDDESCVSDAINSLHFLKHDQIDTIVVDSYYLDVRWETIVSEYVNRVVVIDDLANRRHACDILLDSAEVRSSEDYHLLVPPQTQLLLGPTYALVDIRFRHMRAKSLARRAESLYQVYRVVISFGGGSYSHLVLDILERLKDSDLLNRLEIVILDKELAARDALSEPYSIPNLNVFGFVDDMPDLLCSSDLMIGAPGGTSWECCCLGLPAILLQLADNQKDNRKALQNSGAAICFDNPNEFAAELCQLIHFLSCHPDSVKSMVESSSNLCDGLGASRGAYQLYL